MAKRQRIVGDWNGSFRFSQRPTWGPDVARELQSLKYHPLPNQEGAAWQVYRHENGRLHAVVSETNGEWQAVIFPGDFRMTANFLRQFGPVAVFFPELAELSVYRAQTTELK